MLATRLHSTRDVAPTEPLRLVWRGGALIATGGCVADVGEGDLTERQMIEAAVAAVLTDGSIPEHVLATFERFEVEPVDDLAEEYAAPEALASRRPAPRPAPRARGAVAW